MPLLTQCVALAGGAICDMVLLRAKRPLPSWRPGWRASSQVAEPRGAFLFFFLVPTLDVTLECGVGFVYAPLFSQFGGGKGGVLVESRSPFRCSPPVLLGVRTRGFFWTPTPASPPEQPVKIAPPLRRFGPTFSFAFPVFLTIFPPLPMFIDNRGCCWGGGRPAPVPTRPLLKGVLDPPLSPSTFSPPSFLDLHATGFLLFRFPCPFPFFRVFDLGLSFALEVPAFPPLLCSEVLLLGFCCWFLGRSWFDTNRLTGSLIDLIVDSGCRSLKPIEGKYWTPSS